MNSPKHTSPYSSRLGLLRRPTKAAKALAFAAILAAAGLPFFTFSAQAVDTQDVFISGTSLTTTNNYSQGVVPTSAYDLIFGPTFPTATLAATISATTLTVGSLDDFGTSTIGITNGTSTSTASTLTLGPTSGNAVAPSASDLLFVGPSGTLNIGGNSGGGTGVLNVALGQSGNFDIAGNGAAAISSVISGTGFGITKTGTGTLTLTGANTFNSGATVNAGTLVLGSTAATGTVLGGVTLNGGILQIAQSNSITSGTIALNGGVIFQVGGPDISARFSTAANQQYNIGIASSTVTYATALTSVGGSLVRQNSYSGNLNLTAANTYTGTTTLAAGNTTLSGATGSLASTSAITLAGGTLTLTNTGAGLNNNNRLSDSAPVNVISSTLILNGSDQATNTTETIGAVTVGGTPTVLGAANILSGAGANAALTVNFGGTNTATLTTSTITRTAGANALLVNGTSLGMDDTSTASVGRLLLTGTAPTLVGTTAPSTTINAASQNTRIVPGFVGEATATTGGLGTATGTANTFVTYTSTGGFRPLNPTDEFTNNSIVTGNNTRITAATSSATSTAINSLVIAGGFNLTLGTTTLTDTSGMVLFGAAGTITGGTLAFGANEGIIYNNTSGVTGTINSTITGSGGLTKSGTSSLTLGGIVSTSGGLNVNGGLLLVNGANTFTGQTIIANGATVGTSTGTAASFGATGTGNEIVIQNGGHIRIQDVNITLAKNIIVSGAGAPTANLAPATATAVPTAIEFSNTNAIISGNIQLAGDSAIGLRSSTVAHTPTISGVISDQTAGANRNVAFSRGEAAGSGVTDVLVLSAQNTYGGNTFITDDVASTATSNFSVNLTNATNSLPATTVVTLGGLVNIGGANVGLATAAGQLLLGTGSTAATQTIAGLVAQGNVAVDAVQGNASVNSTLTVNNTGNNVYQGLVGSGAAGASNANNLALVKSNNGMLQLAGATSYNGGTTVNGGTLIFGGTGGTPATPVASTGTGAITVNNAGSVLGGTGSLAGAVTVNNGAGITGGGLNVVGTLTLANTANVTTLAAGSVYLVDIGAGALSDKLAIAGALLSNGATIQINSGTLDGTDTYTIATFASDTGSTFTLMGVTGYTLDDSTGTSLRLIPTAVPEPSTYVGGLLLVGALGWSVRRRFVQNAV